MLANPLNRNRAVTLTLDQFKYGWANALSDEEAKELYDSYHVATPGVALMQMANAKSQSADRGEAGSRQSEPRAAALIEGEKHGSARSRGAIQAHVAPASYRSGT